MKKTIGLATAFKVATGSVLLVASASAFAQNAANGKVLYNTKLNPAYLSCSDNSQCHGPDPSLNKNKIRNGTNPNTIMTALNSVPLMNPDRGYLTLAQATDIAAYIANPAAANAPAITASATSLAFGTTQVGATSAVSTPASVTLTNTGAGTLTITGINKSGTNAADFTATGTCVGASVTVAPGATCTLGATFSPTATGTRTATLTVASNAPTNPAISLSGTGSAVPVAAASLSVGSLTFPTQTISTTSAARTVTLTNTGNAALSVTQVATTPNPEFAATSNCVGTVNAGASCTISVTFTPSAAGTRSGTLSITSNAATSPNTITLAGTSVLAATPIATCQSTAVAFPMTNVGVMSSGLSTTLTNTGNAPLQITGVAIGGTNASDFRLGAGNTCAVGTLAVGASCLLEVAFQPSSSGTKSATVTITHNASGGSTTVAVSGTAATPTSTSTTGPTGGTSPSSSALAPSNVGGGGSLSPLHLGALAMTLLLVPALRRRLAPR
jgi:hypothetical protein